MWINLVVKIVIVFHLTAAATEVDGDGVTETNVARRPVVKAKELDWATLDVAVPPRRVFKMSFNANMFSWSEGNLGGLERHEYKYTPALRDSAGLPAWMKYRYSRRHKAGFLYGVPPAEPGQLIEIDVVAVNRATFEYGLLRLALNVTEDDGDPAGRHAVRLKIDNLDVVDLFDAHRMRNLKALFALNLWNGSRDDLYLASVASAVDLGFRRPLDPALRDGLVVILASEANFSRPLLDLDQETAVLRGFPSCPRDFKRTSVERHFRAKGFALDWCEFRLLRFSERSGDYLEIGEEDEEGEDGRDETQKIDPANSTTILVPPIKFPRKNELPLADLTFLYVQVGTTHLTYLPDLTIFCTSLSQTIVPTLFLLMLLFLLLSLIFCLRCPCALEDDEDLMVETSSGGGESDKWDGLTASFFLVLKDCVTCCNSVDPRDKARTVFLRNRERSEPQNLNRLSSCGDPRCVKSNKLRDPSYWISLVARDYRVTVVPWLG